MTRVLQTQHSRPPSATGFLVQRPLRGYISSAPARSPLHLLSRKERKNISLGAFCKDFFFLDWVLKYGDLWLIVQFIKVIFPDAVILGLLTHQGCPCSHP